MCARSHLLASVLSDLRLPLYKRFPFLNVRSFLHVRSLTSINALPIPTCALAHLQALYLFISSISFCMGADMWQTRTDLVQDWSGAGQI